jgi:hypothetical protein
MSAFAETSCFSRPVFTMRLTAFRHTTLLDS